jgi:branched-subunit amino acid aminotransferase/4-amino-4-deoxychorismate lyase
MEHEPWSAGAIAWIESPEGGRWGAPSQLSVPLADRGLTLADGIFETVLVEGGRPRLLREHLGRWGHGAALLGLPPPPHQSRVSALLEEAIVRSGIRTGALRLNWSRGDGGRGIDLPLGAGADPVQGLEPGGTPRFWLQLSALRPGFAPVSVIISRQERRNAASRLSGCKTFAYGPAVQARREARLAGHDDALLESTAGGLCCGTTANLLVRHPGGWWTPPLTSGCLPGVMRARGLDLGLLQEAPEPITADRLHSGALLLNSLGCHPIQSLAGERLPLEPEPERLWRRLLGGG